MTLLRMCFFFTRKSILSDHLRVVIIAYKYYTYTVKPAHAVTSIKQSSVLKDHFFLVLS